MCLIIILIITIFYPFATTENGPIPPPFWCENDTLAEKAGVIDQCKSYNTSAFEKHIKLTLFYETLCPGCQGLIKDILYPQVWTYGKDFVDLELVPYGNAKRKRAANGTYEISCQHGPKECQLNKLHSCIINQLTDINRWFPLIYCIETAISGGQDPDAATKACYGQQGIKASEQKKINDCSTGTLGDQLQNQAADRTESAKPDAHKFVPWIMINDISLEKAQIYQQILFLALCDWYRSEKTPSDCSLYKKMIMMHKKSLKLNDI